MTSRATVTLCLLLVIALASAVSACSDDAAVEDGDDSEFINQVTLTLMRRQDSTFQSATITDPDGRGPLPPGPQSGRLSLVPNASYTATITLVNSLVSPPVDVTPLVNARKLQHRFFYTVTPDNGVIATDLTIDSNSAWYGEALAIHVPATVESRDWMLRVELSHYEGDTKGDGMTPSPHTDIDVMFVLGT